MIRSPYAVALADAEHVELLGRALTIPCAGITSGAEVVSHVYRRELAAVFVDAGLLPQLHGMRAHVPIIAIIDEYPAQAVAETVRLLLEFPFLSHVINASMLPARNARVHLARLLERLIDDTERPMLGPSGVGRVAQIAQASKREARFDRIQQFFAKQGLSPRTLGAIHEVCEELVMNALYDAPYERKFFAAPVPRTEDVVMPPDRACEISYGIERGNAFVRVRDTFGSLSRARLLQVLDRCSAGAVSLDESRGGAGLGMWRIFSTASTIAISVVPGVLTDICVGLATENGRIARELVATHLFFDGFDRSVSDALLPPTIDFDRSITFVA